MSAIVQSAEFGELRQVVKDRIENIDCEIAYYDKDGVLVGYWAYGHFDPDFPYQGK